MTQIILKHQIKTIATENGAAIVGIASRERLTEAPPSGDPSYLLPSTQSIISFGIPYDQEALAGFFSKTDWRREDCKKKNQQLLLVRL